MTKVQQGSKMMMYATAQVFSHPVVYPGLIGLPPVVVQDDQAGLHGIASQLKTITTF